MATAVKLDESFRWPTTAEELLAMPDGTHGEIVEGVYVPLYGDNPMTAPGGLHGIVTSRIDRLIGNFIDARQLGATFGAETGFMLTRQPDTVRCPDCAFVSSERLPAVFRQGANEGAPDLAVEVLSPSNTATEMQRKVSEYLRHGARQVWVVDPETRTVMAYTAGGFTRFLERDDVLDGGELLPGFSTPIAAFFAGLPEPARHQPPVDG